MCAMRDRLDDVKSVGLEHTERALLEADDDERAVGRVLARTTQLFEHAATQQPHALALQTPHAQRLVVAGRAALELARMTRQAPQLTFAMTLNDNAHDAVLVDVDDLAVLGADENLLGGETDSAHGRTIGEQNAARLLRQRLLVQTVLVYLAELCIPQDDETVFAARHERLGLLVRVYGEYRSLVRRYELDELLLVPHVDGAVAAARIAHLGLLAERDAHHVLDLGELAEQAAVGRESAAHLRPELDVLDAYGDQLVAGVRIPLDAEDLLLVAARCRQLLALLPLPHAYRVVVVQAHRGELFAIAFISYVRVNIIHTYIFELL